MSITFKQYRQYADWVIKERQSSPKKHPFSIEREKVFLEMKEQNISLFKTFLPSHLLNKIENCSLTQTESTEIHGLYEEYIYSKELIAGEIFYNFLTKKRSEIPKLIDANLRNKMDRLEKINELVHDLQLMMVLIRPENLYLNKLIKDYIVSEGFQILHVKDLTMSLSNYLALYSHVFEDRIKESHVRRRAIGYIDQKCQLLVFSQCGTKFNSADQFNERYKGKIWQKDDCTLRGAIAHREALVNFYDSRVIVQHALNPYRAYDYLNVSILEEEAGSRYVNNLHGIHTPENVELLKDLSVFLEDTDIAKISNLANFSLVT